MVSVRKSPNMMSITGRIPVIAAPTPTPVNPASEIGVSITRSLPNSSTRPDKTLNGVPASATSSPRMHTRESRRISSASASRTACAKVNSRLPFSAKTSGIHVLLRLFRTGIRGGDCKIDRGLHLFADFGFDLRKSRRLRKIFLAQPLPKQLDGVALRLPLLLFLLRAVILAIDVSHVVPGVAIRVAYQERGTLAAARALHQFAGGRIYGTHILPVNAFRGHSERSAAVQNVPRGGLRIMGVLVVEIVLANVDYRQLPQRREIHDLIEHALP